MKAMQGLGLAVVLSASLAGGAWLWRHYHKPPLPYFTQPVRIEDIESTVTALGQIDASRASVEAAVPEADIFKLHPGQPVFFNLVAVPDQRFSGAVQEVRVIPIGVPPPQATADPPKKDAAGNPLETDDEGDPVDPDTGFTMQSQAPKPNKDAYVSKDGVFYRVLFSMDQDIGRFPVGMSVTVHVVLGVAKQVPTVSMMALGKPLGDNRYEIEVIGANGQPQTREITTGLSDNLSIEVKSGVKPGEITVIRADPSIYEPGYRR